MRLASPYPLGRRSPTTPPRDRSTPLALASAGEGPLEARRPPRARLRSALWPLLQVDGGLAGSERRWQEPVHRSAATEANVSAQATPIHLVMRLARGRGGARALLTCSSSFASPLAAGYASGKICCMLHCAEKGRSLPMSQGTGVARGLPKRARHLRSWSSRGRGPRGESELGGARRHAVVSRGSSKFDLTSASM